MSGKFMTKEEIRIKAQKCFSAAVIGEDKSEYINFAFWLLENKIESENIFILAGLSKDDLYDLQRYFHRVLDDFGIKIDESKDLYFYVAYLYDMVKDGKYSPTSAVSDLYDVYYKSEGEIFGEWQNLFYQIESLEEGFPPYHSTMTNENMNAYILRFFELWFAFYDLKLPEDFSKQAYCKKCGSRIFPTEMKRGFFKKWLLDVCPKCKSDKLAWCSDNTGKELYLKEIGYSGEKAL